VLPFPCWFLQLTHSTVHLRLSPRLTRRMNPSSRSSCPLAPGGIFSQWSGRCTPATRKVINHHPCNPGWSSKKCCGNLKLRNRTLRKFSRKQHFIVSTQTQWTHVQRLSPQNKEASPYVHLQAGYRSKKQSSTHLWLHVTFWIFHFPSAMWPSCFNSLSFISLLCHPFPCLIRTQPVCFFSGPPPCYNTADVLFFWLTSCSRKQLLVSFSMFCQGGCLLVCTIFPMTLCGQNMLPTRCKWDFRLSS
jgi:hypothetical protein